MLTSKDVEIKQMDVGDVDERRIIVEGEYLEAQFAVHTSAEIAWQTLDQADNPEMVRTYVRNKLVHDLFEKAYGDLRRELIGLQAGMRSRLDPRNGGAEMVGHLDDIIASLEWESVD